MNIFAINEARKPPRIGSLAIVSSVVFGFLGAAGPAFSADLPYDYWYNSSYYNYNYNYNYNAGYTYNNPCYRCYCCQQWPVSAQVPVYEQRPYPVAEHRWIQRDYTERHYPYYNAGYAYPPHRYPRYPDRYRYSDYYPGPGAGPDPNAVYEAPPAGEPRRRVGALQYPPAPAAYEHRAESHELPYRYVATSRPPYEHRPAYEYGYRPTYEYDPPQQPATPPNEYYRPGYPE